MLLLELSSQLYLSAEILTMFMKAIYSRCTHNSKNDNLFFPFITDLNSMVYMSVLLFMKILDYSACEIYMSL